MVNIISRELHAFQQMTHRHLKYEFMAVVLKKTYTTVQKFGVSKIFFQELNTFFSKNILNGSKVTVKIMLQKIDRNKCCSFKSSCFFFI